MGRKGHFFSKVFLQTWKQVLQMETVLEACALRSHSPLQTEPSLLGGRGWKCSQACGSLVISSFQGLGSWWEPRLFFFSCWSKIMFCLGPKPHAPGSPAPCWLAPVLVLSTASPSARHFLAWMPRGRVPHKSFAASESQSPLSSLDPDSRSGMEAATG